MAGVLRWDNLANLEDRRSRGAEEPEHSPNLLGTIVHNDEVMKRILALVTMALVTMALLLTGCATPAPAETQAGVKHTIGDRSYLLTVPGNLPSGPVRLVVMLHGGFGSGSQAEKSYGWDALAASKGFVVAYPDGIGRAWNVGAGCCGKPGREATDDVAFIRAVVTDVSSRLNIDPARIYATGMSNGALLSYRLACDTDLFAAIAPVAGTILGECDSPAPISVLEIHGMDDKSVRMDGGTGSGVAAIDGLPVQDVAKLWRAVNNCEPSDATTVGLVTTSTATCPAGRAVTLITIAGAGHQWPGSDAVRDGAVPPSTALDATSTIWAFFAAHSR